MENGYLWMMCHIVYTGSMIPIYKWTKANTLSAIAANTSNCNNTSIPFTMTSSLRVQLHYDDNGVVFKCTITFELPSNSRGNSPDFEYTWNYTANVVCKYTCKSHGF